MNPLEKPPVVVSTLVKEEKKIEQQLNIDKKKTLVGEDLDRKILELKAEGLSTKKVAKLLDVDPKVVYKRYRRALEIADKDQQIVHDVTAFREKQHARLEKLIGVLWETALLGDLKSIDMLVKLMQRQASLWGLDAPKKIDLGLFDFRNLSLEQVKQLAVGVDPTVVLLGHKSKQRLIDGRSEDEEISVIKKDIEVVKDREHGMYTVEKNITPPKELMEIIEDDSESLP